ncbi:MAG TPA: O-antigen ligase family protein [Ramlibacter sp.]|nr:O-antigen ligase family protein [Ramlibacter sp.]
MNSRGNANDSAGLAGPAAILGGMLLLAFAPVLRGGDYFIALIPIEIASLAVLLSLATRFVLSAPATHATGGVDALIAVLVASPLLIAFVQLTPIPAGWWEQLPGHARYAESLRAIGIQAAHWRAISISPDATRASLLAGLPLAAMFLLGLLAGVHQMRTMLRVVAAIAFAQVLLGLLQLSGGEHSPFYFGFMTYGSPIGSFGTRNEYANYLALALAAYVWLAYDATRYTLRLQAGSPLTSGRFDDRHALAAWVLGGLVIVVGILISHSRAGAVFGLGAALLALAAAGLRVFGWMRGWRFALPIAIVLVVGGIIMVGPDAVVARLSGDQLGQSAGFRRELWRTTWHAALAFFPFGSGWGTYDIAYRPFQTPLIVGYANHAHMDPLEMFLEGGAVFLLLAGCFAWLAARRVLLLLRQAWWERTLDRESMMTALCGIGLAGFLAHSMVDFPMRVPGNAILAALLAGVFLRPLSPGTARAAGAAP